MIDQEQLELAAKTAGYRFRVKGTYFIEVASYSDLGQMCLKGWNPLEDDGDALRLAVKLRMLIQYTNSTVIVCDSAGNQLYMCGLRDDPYAATRRAIVRAAAEIGKGMK